MSYKSPRASDGHELYGIEPVWIWIGDGGYDKNAHILFRREFQVDSTREIKLYLSAETRYHAYLNGKRVGEGPPTSPRRLTYYDTHAISGLVEKGKNCLSLVVQQVRPMFGRSGLWAALTGPGGEAIEISAPGWR